MPWRPPSRPDAGFFDSAEGGDFAGDNAFIYADDAGFQCFDTLMARPKSRVQKYAAKP